MLTFTSILSRQGFQLFKRKMVSSRCFFSAGFEVEKQTIFFGVAFPATEEAEQLLDRVSEQTEGAKFAENKNKFLE